MRETSYFEIKKTSAGELIDDNMFFKWVYQQAQTTHNKGSEDALFDLDNSLKLAQFKYL